MRMRKRLVSAAWAVLCIALMTSGCALRLSGSPAPASTSTILIIPTLLPPPTLVVASTPTPTASIPPTSTPVDFCADPQVTTLIGNFKSALQTSNGVLFASLVSSIHGMDVRLYRNGPVISYDQQHAQLLLDSTDNVDWGAAPSGLETKGSFQEVIVPALLKVFNKDYMLDCNQIQIGGAPYKAAWPYAGVDFYSVYFPGSTADNNLDWRTWLIGMEYVKGQPYLTALVQFFWEP
jgi:hypothetical protein